MKKKFKKRSADDDVDSESGDDKRKKIVMTEDEFNEKIKEAKVTAANRYRQQTLLSQSTIDLPEPTAACLISVQTVLKATRENPNFWRDGRRIGVDTDSSLNIACKNSRFFFEDPDDVTPVSVNGVGGSETLTAHGDWILPMRTHKGRVSVVKMKALRSEITDLNIVSAQALYRMGYYCVLGATHVMSQFEGKNPPTSPEGHALISPSGEAIWLKIVNGILVLDLPDVRGIKPDEVPVGQGEVQYRSAKAVRKRRVETEARRLRDSSDRTYAEALFLAKKQKVDDKAEVYLTDVDNYGGNCFGKPSLRRI